MNNGEEEIVLENPSNDKLQKDSADLRMDPAVRDVEAVDHRHNPYDAHSINMADDDRGQNDRCVVENARIEPDRTLCC